MKNLGLTVLFVALLLVSCKKEVELHQPVQKSFVISNTMMKTITLGNVEFCSKDRKSNGNKKKEKTLNDSCFMIPKKALISDKNQYFVVVFKSQSDVKVQQIKLKKKLGDMVCVSGNFCKRDRVVTNNQVLIYNALNE